MDDVLLEVLPDEMKNPFFRVQVRPYAFGQFRIQLWRDTDPWKAVRQLCTYKRTTMERVVFLLKESIDPEDTCEKFAIYPEGTEEYDGKYHNCENRGGRIRLDFPEDNPIKIS